MQKLDLQPGAIIAFSGASVVSRIIRLRTWSEYSHVALAVEITRRDVEEWYVNDRQKHLFPYGKKQYLANHAPGLCLIESTMLSGSPCLATGQRIKGVQLQDPIARINEYNGSLSVLTPEVPLSDALRSRLAMHALSLIGTPYDGYGTARLGTFAYQHLTGWFATDRSSVFCSELVEFLLQQLQYGCLGYEPGEISPAALVTCHAGTTHLFPQRIVKPCV